MSRDDLNILLYRLKKDEALRACFQADPRAALADADLTDEERQAFVEWNVVALNAFGGVLHLLQSIPGRH
jgi:hypothetical protein